MKSLDQLRFGFSDAENYKRRENRDLFNQIFLRTEELDEICGKNIFFLVGEKGTGKTAYAVYFANNRYRDHVGVHRFIRETDYQKFIALKRANHLSLSDYIDIWKVIIYLLLSSSIYDNARDQDSMLRYVRFGALKSAMDEYYDNAFSPEIPAALKLIEESHLAADVFAKHGILGTGLKMGKGQKSEHSAKKFQTNLLFLERNFEAGLSSLKLSQSHILFIDGIDIRPASVPYDEYLDCVKGLANAVWSINNDFFPAIKDTPGRLRVVMLVRPDIFNSLGLQNRNTKLSDNSVVLDWRTTYSAYRSSKLFRMADRLLSVQQEEAHPLGATWDHYFPFDAATVYANQVSTSSFVVFLRYSFYRPRDILKILDILHRLYVEAGLAIQAFTYDQLFTPEFRRAYGDYLLGEVKDSLSFYYDDKEFENFLKFFEFLDGAHKFSYDIYLKAYEEFADFLKGQTSPVPSFLKSEDEFLQFLYDLGIICFIEEAEGEKFFRWCFIERSPTNISPKVRPDMIYEIHYGLANTLNTGKAIKRGKSTRRQKQLGVADRQNQKLKGTIKHYHAARGFGFIKSPDIPVDIFFGRESIKSDLQVLKPGTLVEYKLEKRRDGRLVAIDVTIS